MNRRKVHTLLLNSGHEPRSIIPVERAFTLLYEDGSRGNGDGRIEVVLSALDVRERDVPSGMRVWRSVHDVHPVPLVVRLTRPLSPLFDLDHIPVGAPTLRGLIRRDKGHCLYCLRSRRDLLEDERWTIDHIIPQSHLRSRKAAHRWDNTCLCCSTCNTTKRDRTPEQAGMTLHGIPLTPTAWQILEADLLPCQRAFVRKVQRQVA